jgi:hypothetical protein
MMHPMGRAKLNSTYSLRACVYLSLHTHMVPLKIVVHEFADGSERPRSCPHDIKASDAVPAAIIPGVGCALRPCVASGAACAGAGAACVGCACGNGPPAQAGSEGPSEYPR